MHGMAAQKWPGRWNALDRAGEPAMSDTQRGDISPTTGSTELTDGGEKSGPNWEKIARRKLSTEMTAHFDQEVRPLIGAVSMAIENGEDPTDDMWAMISRFGEFCTRVREGVSTVGEISFREPKAGLHSDARYVEDQLLNLGSAVERDSLTDSPRGDEFDRARLALKQAEAHVDELEEEYRDKGEGDQENSRFPTEKEHEAQLSGIARREEKKRVYSDD